MSIALPPERATGPFIGGPSLSRTAPLASSAPSFLLRCFFAVFLVFDFPAFTIQLAMDPSTGTWVGSPVMQLMTMGSELFVLVYILSSHNIRTLVLRSWPIWILVVTALASVLWSRNPAGTIHNANTYVTTALFGLIMVGAMPQFQSVRFVIRTMVLGCALSLLWVFVFPEVAIHQPTDLYQTVHAGLWRGIFSHKQGLGYFAGLTVGLLLFYRTLIFPVPMLVASLAVSGACLIGSGSATGFVAAILTPALFYIAYSITQVPTTLRYLLFLKFALAAVAAAVAFKSGILNFIIVNVLDKSLDLTGRADIWPMILQSFDNSGLKLLGGGYGGDLAGLLSEYSVDNGYIDVFLEFGLIFSPVIFGVFIAILWAAVRGILKVPPQLAHTSTFAFGIWSITLILNITESNFMTKCLSTILTSMAVGIIVQNCYLITALQLQRPRGAPQKSALAE